MSFIDSHCHIHFPAYDNDRDAVLQRAREAGVKKLLLVGTQFSTSEAAIRLAKEFPGECLATAGFHPNHVSEEWHHDAKEQQEAAREHFDMLRMERLGADPSVAAIGECGLDYYRLPDDPVHHAAIKKAQREVFISQIGIAKRLGKPLMIHCRPSKGTDDAYEDLYGIIIGHGYAARSVIHFYVGSPAMTEKLVEAGFSFTFGGVITFSGDYDGSLDLIPFSRLLIETDCPYVAPLSRRGKRNEPSFVIETYEAVARKKKTTVPVLKEAVAQNFQRLFGVKLV